MGQVHTPNVLPHLRSSPASQFHVMRKGTGLYTLNNPSGPRVASHSPIRQNAIMALAASNLSPMSKGTAAGAPASRYNAFQTGTPISLQRPLGRHSSTGQIAPQS